MDGVFVEKFDDVFLTEVGSDKVDVLGDGVWGVILVLEEGEGRPFWVFLPEFENGFGALQGAAPSEVENALGNARDIGLVEVEGGEAGEVAGGMVFIENLESVLAFAENMIDFLESREVALGKAFLVWDEDIGLGGGDPAGEDSLKKDVGIEAISFPEERSPERDITAMAYCDLVTCGACCLVDEVNITI